MFNLENQAEAFFIAEAPISYCQVFDKWTEDEHHLKSAETRVEVGGLLPTVERMDCVLGRSVNTANPHRSILNFTGVTWAQQRNVRLWCNSESLPRAAKENVEHSTYFYILTWTYRSTVRGRVLITDNSHLQYLVYLKCGLLFMSTWWLEMLSRSDQTKNHTWHF